MTSRRTYREELDLAATEESVRDAGRRMRERNVEALVVVDELHGQIGILTDRDLALAAVGGRVKGLLR
jgi:CBS domain-containing protein